jgi:hypothetical protein
LCILIVVVAPAPSDKIELIALFTITINVSFTFEMILSRLVLLNHLISWMEVISNTGFCAQSDESVVSLSQAVVGV